jgi:hypothetical protein
VGQGEDDVIVGYGQQFGRTFRPAKSAELPPGILDNADSNTSCKRWLVVHNYRTVRRQDRSILRNVGELRQSLPVPRVWPIALADPSSVPTRD